MTKGGFVGHCQLVGCLSEWQSDGMDILPAATKYKNHRFPVEIISHAVWLYFRFCLSFRDVEELLLERGIVVTYEAIRKWCRKFGQQYANQLRRRRPRPGDKWGGVVDLDFMSSHRETKLIAIDKQTNDNVVQLGRPGKADRFACEAFDSRAQRQMLPFNLLRIAFARHLGFRDQMPSVRSPLIGKEACDPKGLQQGFEL